MHIAFVSTEYVTTENSAGGIANYLKKVGQELLWCGHSISIFTLSGKNATWDDQGVQVYEVKPPLVSHLFINLLVNLHLASLLQAYRLWITSGALKKAVFQVHRHRPIDLIQVSNYLAPGSRLVHNHHIPIVTRLSSYQPLNRAANHGIRNFSTTLCEYLEVYQANNSDGCFSPSIFTSRIFQRFEHITPQIIRTPLDRITKEKDESIYQTYFANKQYLLYVGTLEYVKGTDLIGMVAPAILREFPEIHFVFIGRQSRTRIKKKSFFEQHVAEPCWEYIDRVQFFHVLPKSQLYPIMEHALGVLMPSRADNYPNVCLEAYMCGVPVIGSEDSSLDEMIIDGETGFLAKNGDADSLRESIRQLLRLTPIQRARMKQTIQMEITKIQQENRVAQLEAYLLKVKNEFQGK
jgi:glycogen synthase